MMGYTGSVFISTDEAGTDFQIIPVTGSSSSRNRRAITSSAGYGGNSDVTDASAAVGTPRAYDWPEYSLSCDFDPTKKAIKVLFDWISARQEYRKVQLYPRNGSQQFYDECYFQSLNLSASQGGNVSASLTFLPTSRNEIIPTNWILGQSYTAYRKGSFTSTEMDSLLAETWNPKSSSGPIPYWATSIDMGSGVEVTNWSWDFNNSAELRYLCSGNNDTMQPPTYVAIGPADCSLNLTMVLTPGAASTYTIPSQITSEKLILVTDTDSNEYSVTMDKLDLDSDDDPVRGASDITTFDLKYYARGKLTLLAT